jgi:3-oxoacyl-[acyl-carrier-protein] synthase II
MSLYIQGMGYILPQLGNAKRDADFLTRGEPDYEQWIDVRQLRRMSRIIKMGVTSALMALKNSGIEKPDAIITGTGYGCLDDSGIFLSKVVDENNPVLNPTPFIQSTHNTIGSQIALLLQCLGYNQTYSQGSFSFEHALLDAVLLSNENPEQKILVGGVDEITTFSAAILKRFKSYRDKDSFTLETNEGLIIGEGAAYYVLSGTPSAMTNVCVEAVSTLYKPTKAEWELWIDTFMDGVTLGREDVSLLLVGESMLQPDEFNNSVIQMFSNSTVAYFKQVSGEYPTASALALSMATVILQEQHVPDSMLSRGAATPLRNVLIYNQYFGTHHSLILLRLCHAMQK